MIPQADSVDRHMTVKDITAEQFQTLVIDASHDRPVVVDFWAPWCGPCHQLSPLLERVAERHAAQVDTVKLNVDTAPQVAQQFRVQGIPAVKAFKDGKVAGEFVGVQPEPAIEQLFAGLGPSEADLLVTRAATEPADAEPLLRKALELDGNHAPAIVALASLLTARGDTDEARVLLQRIPADGQARQLLAELDLGGGADEDLDALRTAAADGDATAALGLGRALAARGEHADALPLLLTAVRDPQTRDEARSTVLTVFDLLGGDDDLVRTWRPKLAAALF
jgi:putative thioredoxin